MLRKFSVLVLFIILGVASKAQLTKGNWLVGGSGSYMSEKSNDGAVGYKLLTITPNIGYFLADKFALGIKSGLSYSEFKTENTRNSTTLLFGPFLRYYFMPTTNQVNLFAEGTYQYANEKPTKQTYNIYTAKAGPVIYFNQSVGLELTFEYSYLGSNPNITYSNRFSIGAGLQIHLEKDN
jgi:hypothetical protein